MPESRSRKKTTYTPPPQKSAGPATNPRWLVPTMLSLMVAGLVWIVVTYLTQSQFPIAALGQWNLGVGFALIIAGFGLTTRWH